METLMEQTGENGFHFVDEAAPPALMREVALEIIKRKLVVSWWTNIRFEKSFTSDLCLLLKESGCIAVSGGLEVASDRLLALIKKGVTVEQVAKVTRNFTASGIMVHAYLMYGYPTQTVQETVDSLEMVRQLFELGVLQSGFWHQFAMTAHSPVGMFPEEYGVIPEQNQITFANNDINFKDTTGINHDKFSYGLKKSLFNYMHGICFEYELQEWFDFTIPRTKIPKEYIHNCLQSEQSFATKPNARIVWLGGQPQTEISIKSKKGISWNRMKLTFHKKTQSFDILVSEQEGAWLLSVLEKLTIGNEKWSYSDVKADFEKQGENFELFWYSKPMQMVKNNGLITL
jgi:hypothetical protein